MKSDLRAGNLSSRKDANISFVFFTTTFEVKCVIKIIFFNLEARGHFDTIGLID